MYTINIAEEFENTEGNPDYEGMMGVQVPTENISDIMDAMFLMEVTIYRITEDMKTVYESVRLREIMQRRAERRAGIST